MTRRKNPIRRSLNKTVLVLGIEHRLFGGFFFGTIGLFYVTRSFRTAFLFMVAWIAAGRWVSKKDPQFFRILFAGMSEQTRYDAKMSATQEVTWQ
jgi:type IV secretory pathway TrbD component